jgi:carbon monoxide dehydrogenase subunit G
MAYSFNKAIVIDRTKVEGGVDLANFTIPVAGTYSFLKTAANGGDVQNGNDIAFFSDSGLTTQLKHDIERYDPVTGQVAFWVKIPSLSVSVDTTIYIAYGDAAVVTDQSDKVNTWDADFEVVIHDPSTGIDSTSNTNDGTPSGGVAQVDGKLGKGGSFDGVDDIVTILDDPTLNPANVTVEVWYKGTDAGTKQLFSKDNGSDQRVWQFRVNGGNFEFIPFNAGSNSSVASSIAVNDDTWRYLVATYDGTTSRLFINGVPNNTDTGISGDLRSGQINNVELGGGLGAFLTGLLDEARISSVVRTAGWIKTHFNAINSPSTFYSIAIPPTITTTSLPNAQVGEAYSEFIETTGGVGDIDFAIVAGALPAWASLNAETGEITGTPLAEAGAVAFTVEAEDSTAETDQQALSITVTGFGGFSVSGLNGEGNLETNTALVITDESIGATGYEYEITNSGFTDQLFSTSAEPTFAELQPYLKQGVNTIKQIVTNGSGTDETSINVTVVSKEVSVVGFVPVGGKISLDFSATAAGVTIAVRLKQVTSLAIESGYTTPVDETSTEG